jgi:hypothetical protein
MDDLVCMCSQVPVPGWRENLHVAADIAVIAAVLVGAIALVVQLRERRSRRAAVDVRLRTGALQAYRQLKGALDPESPGPPGMQALGHLSYLFATVGAAMDQMLRALAADAPEASGPLERSVSGAYAAYWHARSLHERSERTETTARQALDEMAQCVALLKEAAGPQLLP